MRDALLWGSALLFLLAALFTVAVHREVDGLGREIGVLSMRLCEDRRREDDLDLLRERLRSPLPLLERAEQAGLGLARKGGRTLR